MSLTQAAEMLKPKSLNSKNRIIDFGLKVSKAKFAFEIVPALKHSNLNSKIITTQSFSFIFKRTARINQTQPKRLTNCGYLFSFRFNSAICLSVKSFKLTFPCSCLEHFPHSAINKYI